MPDLLDLIHFLGLSQTLLLAAYFWSRRAVAGFRIVSGLFVLLSAALLLGWLYHSHRILSVPELSRVGLPLGAFMAPLLFLAQRSHLTGRGLAWRDLRLFPVGFGIIAYLLPFFFADTAEKIRYVREDLKQIHFDCVVISLLTYLNNVAFFSAAAWMVYRKWTAAPPEQRGYLRLHLVFDLVVLVYGLAGLVWFFFDNAILNSGALSAALAAMIMVFAYLLVYHDREEPWLAYFRGGAKYKKSLLDDERLERIARDIEEYFTSERPFLEPGFRLDTLARRLELSSHQVSQVLSRRLDTKFSEYVNGYRIEYAKRLLRDPGYADQPVLRIAFESGFDSKSSFNLAFKKHARMTPSDWRRKVVA